MYARPLLQAGFNQSLTRIELAGVHDWLKPMSRGLANFCLRFDLQSPSVADFRSKTRDKKRCYLCSAYVVHMKQHLENTHVTDVFQCRVKNCFQPKFLEIVKVGHTWMMAR